MRQAILVIAALLAGCVNVPVVEQASNEKPLSTIGLSCTKPYALAQDCSPAWGGGRILSIGGTDLAVAATQDGTIVLVVDAHIIQHTLISYPLIFNSPRVSKAANAAHGAVQELLKASGIEITRAIPLKTFTDTTGYFLHLSGNGYDVLKKNTIRMRGDAESEVAGSSG